MKLKKATTYSPYKKRCNNHQLKQISPMNSTQKHLENNAILCRF